MDTQNIEKNILLEQYKSYMNNLNEIGNQHSQTRGFYVSIISALLVFLSLTGPKEALGNISFIGQFAVALLGIILCIAWFIHTLAFGKLFYAKFYILKEMEKELHFQIFDKEWKKLQEIKYTLLTKIESFVSLAVLIPFIILLYSLYCR